MGGADNPVLYIPDREACKKSRIAVFAKQRGFSNYAQLHSWSVKQPAEFWSALWDFCHVLGEKGEHVFQWNKGENFYQAEWFCDARINYAENILRWSGAETALVYVSENQSRWTISRDELRQSVAACAAALKDNGVSKGDKVAGVLTNSPHAIICMLATTLLGATWSSCSPDFGVNSLIDRLGQVQPKLLFIPKSYLYKGKRYDLSEKIARLQESLRKHTPDLRAVHPPSSDACSDANPFGEDGEDWKNFLARGKALDPVQPVRVPFNHPLVVLFSSGTTGLPKCIIHSHGGVLLKHLSELGMHTDLHESDALSYFTTCGWMMWNWMVSGLLFGSRLVLYDGHPCYPSADRLIELWREEKVSVAGVSAGLISQMEQDDLHGGELPNLRMLCSTGSPLSPSSFDYVYQRIKKDIHLASISGGTDLLGCFMLGVPTLPVRRGEIQAAALGMDLAIYDEKGDHIQNTPGDLVCRLPFPSTPISLGFEDKGYSKYKAAYFEKFPGVWTHGDYVEETTTGFIVYGRSDATLNPGGVRIGSAEVYRPLENIPEIVDALAVDQNWQGSTRMVLFIVLKEGIELNEDLRKKICKRLREQASPRHVPAKILSIPEVPRTLNGKLCELAVREIIHNRQASNLGALANPHALDYFRNRDELAD